eukprot:823611_1
MFRQYQHLPFKDNDVSTRFRRTIGEPSIAITLTESDMAHHHSLRRTNLGMEGIGVYLQVGKSYDETNVYKPSAILDEKNNDDDNVVYPAIPTSQKDIVLPSSFETPGHGGNVNVPLVNDGNHMGPQHQMSKQTSGDYDNDNGHGKSNL